PASERERVRRAWHRHRHRRRWHSRGRHGGPYGRRRDRAARCAARTACGGAIGTCAPGGIRAMTVLRIAGGDVYDPANGIEGVVRDICIADGRVVDDVPPDATTIDARGMVVMPGGVDIHAHVASSSVNVGRRLLPEDHDRDPVRAPRLDEGVARSGTGGTLPTSFSTGYRY